MTTSACVESACIAGVSRDCEDGVFQLGGGATRSQSRRATNCATPRYEVVRLPGRFLSKQARYTYRVTQGSFPSENIS